MGHIHVTTLLHLVVTTTPLGFLNHVHVDPLDQVSNFYLYHTSMKYCNQIGPLQVVYFTYTPVKHESSAHISTYTPVIYMTSSKWRQSLDAEQ